MNAGGPIAIKNNALVPGLSKMFDLSSIPPRLVARDAPMVPSAPPRRSKIWEFSTHLHCSIIGTCLSIHSHITTRGLTAISRCSHEEQEGQT